LKTGAHERKWEATAPLKTKSAGTKPTRAKIAGEKKA
jgi:hypothetical protein